MRDTQSTSDSLSPTTSAVAILVVFLLASFLCGFTVNHFWAAPKLPLSYAPPQVRLDAIAPAETSTTISLAELLEIIDSPSTILVDVRNPLHYKRGYLPGAISLSRRAFSSPTQNAVTAFIDSLPQDPNIILYCQSQTCPDAKLVATALLEKSILTRVYTGGINEWRSNGHPLEK